MASKKKKPALDAALQVRCFEDDKRRWRRAAQMDGSDLAHWVRWQLDCAADMRLGPPAEMRAGRRRYAETVEEPDPAQESFEFTTGKRERR